MQNSSNSSVESGNTQIPLSTPTPAKKTQIAPRIHHFFTWNNYPENWIDLIVPVFKDFNMAKCRIQTEVGESGTPHLQGVVTFREKIRDTSLKLPKTIHWEPVFDVVSAYRYCSKVTSRSPTNFQEYEYPPKPKIITNLRHWQKELYDQLQTEPDDRSIYWYYDEQGGNGKSAFCKYIAVTHPKEVVVIQGGKLADIINIIFNIETHLLKTIIIDIPRANKNYLSFAAIECIKNGMITNTKFETGIKYFDTVHVVIFSNSQPDLSNLSADRWHLRSLENGLAYDIDI
jgi:hypothetical protein